MVKLRVNLQQYACLGTHPHQLVNYFPPLLFTHVLKNARRQANRHDFGQFALIFGEAPKNSLDIQYLQILHAPISAILTK